MVEALQVVNTELAALGINYEFGSLTQTPIVYPYWIGDYNESNCDGASGAEHGVMTLTGFTRGKYLEMETQKSLIKERFKHGVITMTASGVAVAIYFSSSLDIPQEDETLKRSQINLEINIWKG